MDKINFTIKEITLIKDVFKEIDSNKLDMETVYLINRILKKIKNT